MKNELTPEQKIRRFFKKRNEKGKEMEATKEDLQNFCNLSSEQVEEGLRVLRRFGELSRDQVHSIPIYKYRGNINA